MVINFLTQIILQDTVVTAMDSQSHPCYTDSTTLVDYPIQQQSAPMLHRCPTLNVGTSEHSNDVYWSKKSH